MEKLKISKQKRRNSFFDFLKTKLLLERLSLKLFPQVLMILKNLIIDWL
jgi:hypothetical protein